MKNSILIIALILICFGIKAIASEPDLCYVKTADKVYFGTDIKMGLLHTRIVLPDGTFAEVDNRDITAYKDHNKLCLLMPVICNNSDTLCFELMEYVTTKNGYLVYKYCCSRDTEDDRLTTCAKKNYFFVFKDGKFYRRIDEEQTEALAAFGIKVI